MSDADKSRIAKRRAAAAAMGLAPVSFFLVSITNHSPMSAMEWIMAIAVAELCLCLLIGGTAMFLGLSISTIRGDNADTGVLRFGAALGAGVFGIFTLWGIFDRRQ